MVPLKECMIKSILTEGLTPSFKLEEVTDIYSPNQLQYIVNETMMRIELNPFRKGQTFSFKIKYYTTLMTE